MQVKKLIKSVPVTNFKSLRDSTEPLGLVFRSLMVAVVVVIPSSTVNSKAMVVTMVRILFRCGLRGSI